MKEARPLSEGDIRTTKIKAPVFSLSTREDIPVGSPPIYPWGGLNGNAFAPTAITDGRRFRDNDSPSRTASLIGFQTNYASLLPVGTPVDIYWAGNTVEEKIAQQAVAERLREVVDTNTVALLTGGEHIHPNTTGTTRVANSHEVKKYGEDSHRDIVGVEILSIAEEKGLPIVAICRGCQLALHYYSDGSAIPGDHGQDAYHSLEDSPDGQQIFREHAVKDILPEELKAKIEKQFNREIPEVRTVNSAHAQGYRVCDIDEDAMAILNKNGWYPWLVADIDGVSPDQQTYEAWIRVDQKGKITGIMTQFHPERPEAPYGAEVRSFIQDALTANITVDSEPESVLTYQ